MLLLLVIQHITHTRLKVMDYKKLSEKKIVDNLCAAIDVRFEDTKQGLIPATSIANFKIWSLQESELEG